MDGASKPWPAAGWQEELGTSGTTLEQHEHPLFVPSCWVVSCSLLSLVLLYVGVKKAL
jgi:hypothetical protein